MTADWSDYLADFHSRRAGRTEELMGRLTAGGLTPYAWALRPVAGRARKVLDLACGSGAVAGQLHAEGLHPLVVGIDSSEAELRYARDVHDVPVARADAAGLPFPAETFDAAVASMALMVVTPLEAALAECARVIRPGGLLSATLASSRPLRPSDLWLLGRLTARLGTPPQFPGGTGLSELGEVLDAAGFDLLEDARERFGFWVRGRRDAELLLDTLYFPDIDPSRMESATSWLCERAADSVDGVEVATPIRRILAMRR